MCALVTQRAIMALVGLAAVLGAAEGASSPCSLTLSCADLRALWGGTAVSQATCDTYLPHMISALEAADMCSDLRVAAIVAQVRVDSLAGHHGGDRCLRWRQMAPRAL